MLRDLSQHGAQDPFLEILEEPCCIKDWTQVSHRHSLSSALLAISPVLFLFKIYFKVRSIFGNVCYPHPHCTWFTVLLVTGFHSYKLPLPSSLHHYQGPFLRLPCHTIPLPWQALFMKYYNNYIIYNLNILKAIFKFCFSRTLHKISFITTL